MRSSLTALLLVLSVVTSVSAQGRKSARPPAKDPQVCVDVVSFRQGKAARGLIVPLRQVAQDRVLMIVERDELKSDNPTIFAKAANAEIQSAQEAWSQLSQRLEKELASDKLSLPLKSLYEQELAKAQAGLELLKRKQSLDSRFMWLEFYSKEASNIRQTNPEGRRIAIWAWSEKLVDVTRRSPMELKRELEDAGVKLSLKLPDLSKQLTPRPQSEEEWATRLALVRYSLDGGLDFQGSNGIYLRSGRQMQAADMAGLVQKMMGGNLEALIQDLDPAAKAQAKQNKTTWFQPAISEVESAGKTEFRITRLDQDPSGQSATVETALVAKLPTRGWQIVWSSEQTMRADQVDAATEKQLAEDPQVKSILSVLASLGGPAEAEIKKALRFGAATQAAQRLAEGEFTTFRDSFAQRLDGPPL